MKGNFRLLDRGYQESKARIVLLKFNSYERDST